MKRRLLLMAGAGVLILAFHAGYSVSHAQRIAAKWAPSDQPPALSLYITSGDIFLGLSYALAGAFTAYALTRTLDGRKAGVAGAVGGFTLTGLLYFGGCFLIGCCGSPMLGVYLGLFGGRFLGVTKPLVLILTALSVALGWWWLERRAKKGAPCCGDDNCHA
jgi:hypothetical protein